MHYLAVSSSPNGPILQLDKSLGSKKDLAKIRDNLSAVVVHGNHLWLGGDEGTFVDRMTRDANGNFGEHRRFDVGALVKLPAKGPKLSEIDVEGLDVDSGYLWAIGSHSLKRKKVEDDKTAEENRARLEDVSGDGNRYTLVRLPLDTDGEPGKQVGSLEAARLEGDDMGDALTRALATDKQFLPFLAIPSKDNGLDVEGLAVRGNRVFAGLRGPVFRGWAVLMEFEVTELASGTLGLTLPMKKHFLNLEGLGIREIAIHGKDLYILAGPTMDLDGPVFVYRWSNALDNNKEVLFPRKALTKVLTVPFGVGTDHAEGITLIESAGKLQAMICYDSPDAARCIGADAVRADVFDLA